MDLCGGTGAWSQPYRDAGYEVQLVTLPGPDVRDLLYLDRPVLGILCSPPCTVFAASGARWKRTEAEMREALAVVDACLRAVVIYRPAWWALENPVGKLRKYLGPPSLIFNPWITETRTRSGRSYGVASRFLRSRLSSLSECASRARGFKSSAGSRSGQSNFGV